MKKGLFLILTLVTIALLCTSAYGVTLTIDEIPDIIIGDNESMVSTIDNNLFEFTGVFVFDDVVSFSDSSTSQSEVKWSFAEYNTLGGTLQTPGNNWIEINDTDPLSSLGSIWNPPVDISQTPDANFRNIKLSPPPGASYGEPDSQYLAPNCRVINVFATYIGGAVVTSDTETIIAYTIDDVYDSFSPTAMWSDNFETEDTSEWSWSSANVDILKLVTSGSGNMPTTTDWALSMTSTITTSGDIGYGSWYSPGKGDLTVAGAAKRIPFALDKLYNVRWSVVSSQAAALDQPGLRFRIAIGSDATAGDLVIQEGQASEKPVVFSSAAASPTEVDMFWYPSQWLMTAFMAKPYYDVQQGMYLAADMFDNVAAPVGTTYLSKVEVFELDPPASATPVFTAPTFAAGSWIDTTRSAFQTGITSSRSDSGGLTITFANTSTLNFRLRYWDFANVTAIPLNADKLYRAKYTVVSTGAEPPVLRQRLAPLYSYMGAENTITPTLDIAGSTIGYFDYALPGATEREMVGYLSTGNGLKSGDHLTMGMDVYGPYVDTEVFNGVYTVKAITVEELDIPTP
jgi:hypothetical protein